MPQQAGTARMLNTAEPTIVPTPMSPSVMNVPMAFTNNSGADVAAAINVAPATSLDIESAETWNQTLICYFFPMRKLCPWRANDPRRERLVASLLASLFSLSRSTRYTLRNFPFRPTSGETKWQFRHSPRSRIQNRAVAVSSRDNSRKCLQSVPRLRKNAGPILSRIRESERDNYGVGDI